MYKCKYKHSAIDGVVQKIILEHLKTSQGIDFGNKVLGCSYHAKKLLLGVIFLAIFPQNIRSEILKSGVKMGGKENLVFVSRDYYQTSSFLLFVMLIDFTMCI